MKNEKKIVKAVIYPGIGIARVGNSPDEFFIGPESPWEIPNPSGKFKDQNGRVKRQAARFRIYGLDQDDKVIKELTSENCKIEWSVHLANKKASYNLFQGKYNETTKLRNPKVQGDLEPDLRTELIIDGGVKTISGINKSSAPFDSGKFMGKPVYLGELKTDDKGRLLVLGGYGHSESIKPNNPITDYANNNFWHDDTSDGSIEATLTFTDGTAIVAESAWVLITPPKFAPNIYNLVSLYDVIRVTSDPESEDNKVLFYRDIYPILQRASNYAWVNGMAFNGHGAGRGGAFLTPATLKLLSDNSDKGKAIREKVFERIRMPLSLADKKTQDNQANYFYMPQLSGDDGDVIENKPRTWLTVLPEKYKKLQEWAKGNFELDTPESFIPLENYEIEKQPAALNRGVLEPCVGGAFYPGIEMTYISEKKETFRAPFRLSKEFKPGDGTKAMAVPWQADFYECRTHWWPAQRPDIAATEKEYNDIIARWQKQYPADNEDSEASDELAAALAYRPDWDRGLRPNPDDSVDYKTVMPGDNDMIKYWSELGFVTQRKGPKGEIVYVEQERNPYAGLDVRELFYTIQNIDQHPDVLQKARSFAEQSLEWAKQYAKDSATPDLWKYFKYDRDAFQARMMESYNSFVDELQGYDPANDATFKNRDDIIQRIIQMAPFNLTDGAWLRHIDKAGPTDEVQCFLSSILQDERGNGIPSMNHCNIYEDLCHDAGFYPKPVDSFAFAQDPVFLDSAFTAPAFELAISQFTESFYPEIIGMTLQLEWSVVELKTTILLLEYFGFDPHFYVMHVGIDNAVNGHGRRAMDSVDLYLDNIRNMGGEEAVQEHFERIWSGYVAFGNLGTLANDLQNLIQNKVSLHDQVVTMIEGKEAFGSLNHNEKMIGANRINDWFSDPEGFMKGLVEAGYIIPGAPDQSKFFSLLDFETGPMYRVFTDDEITLWKNWTLSLTEKPTPVTPVNSPEAMLMLIKTLKLQQTGNQNHLAMMLKKAGTSEAYSITSWFDRNPVEFMEALSAPENGLIIKGDPDNSVFVTNLISPVNAMGAAFSAVIPKTGNLTGRDIMIKWIKDNCPLPGQKPINKKLWLTSSEKSFRENITGVILGMGTIH